MKQDPVMQVIMIYIYVLIVPIAIGYIYFFYWTIKEGIRRDMLSIGIILVAIIGSPFVSAGFISAASKRDIDRIRISYKNNNGEIISSNLGIFIKNKLALSKLQKIEDINETCRFCKTKLDEFSHSCPKCGKNRKWYEVKIYNRNNRKTEYIEIPELLNLDVDNIIIKDVIRSNNP